MDNSWNNRPATFGKLWEDKIGIGRVATYRISSGYVTVYYPDEYGHDVKLLNTNCIEEAERAHVEQVWDLLSILQREGECL